jgi:hypothetical protein
MAALIDPLLSSHTKGEVEIALLHHECSPAERTPERHPMTARPLDERLPRGTADVLSRLLGGEIDLALWTTKCSVPTTGCSW